VAVTAEADENNESFKEVSSTGVTCSGCAKQVGTVVFWWIESIVPGNRGGAGVEKASESGLRRKSRKENAEGGRREMVRGMAQSWNPFMAEGGAISQNGKKGRRRSGWGKGKGNKF